MNKKPWWQSKTIWVGVATVVGAAGSAVAGEASWVEAIVAAIGLVNIFLRLSTDAGVGKPVDLSALSDDELLAKLRAAAPQMQAKP